MRMIYNSAFTKLEGWLCLESTIYKKDRMTPDLIISLFLW